MSLKTQVVRSQEETKYRDPLYKTLSSQPFKSSPPTFPLPSQRKPDALRKLLKTNPSSQFLSAPSTASLSPFKFPEAVQEAELPARSPQSWGGHPGPGHWADNRDQGRRNEKCMWIDSSHCPQPWASGSWESRRHPAADKLSATWSAYTTTSPGASASVSVWVTFK